jgi:hypothetical protein
MFGHTGTNGVNRANLVGDRVPLCESIVFLRVDATRILPSMSSDAGEHGVGV